MAGIINHDCPWCPLSSAPLVIRHQRMFVIAKESYRQFVVECEGCKKWCLVEVQVDPKHKDLDFVQYPGTIPLKACFQTLSILPSKPSIDAPADTPPAVARPYTQAMKSLQQGSWDAAGVMARKSLDVATYEVDPALPKGTALVRRIDTLAAAHMITPQLQDWAHAIRQDGNEAAHAADEFTEKEARDICEFARTFLEYVFTMPAQLTARKAAVQASNFTAP